MVKPHFEQQITVQYLTPVNQKKTPISVCDIFFVCAVICSLLLTGFNSIQGPELKIASEDSTEKLLKIGSEDSLLNLTAKKKKVQRKICLKLRF